MRSVRRRPRGRSLPARYPVSGAEEAEPWQGGWHGRWSGWSGELTVVRRFGQSDRGVLVCHMPVVKRAKDFL